MPFEENPLKFQLEPYHRDVPDSDLLEELRSVANRLGTKTVTIDQFNEIGLYHSSTLARRFGSWRKALDAAGLGSGPIKSLAREAIG
ncbi:homing endonuclease associated repeat-containing protein [Erythrobacter sp. HL-111]|uniref:homing endonuclease associated repeat-containing protein n=1 Tax=Erythrobacter sp. HL-111 TaxID=1798193 RepID=UPI0012FABBA9